MSIHDRGFASMDRNRVREIASQGGKAAHRKRVAHEWTREEAREAGRKGGKRSPNKGSSQSADTNGRMGPDMEVFWAKTGESI